MYKYTYDEAKSKFKSEFGKELTENQFNYIRRINENYWEDEQYAAICEIIKDDIYYIIDEDDPDTNEQDNLTIGYSSTEFTTKI